MPCRHDRSLGAVVEGIRPPQIEKITPELREVVLFNRAATAKDMGSILVLAR
jgi:hypothetical protein